MTPAQEPRYPIEWLRSILVSRGLADEFTAQTIIYRMCPCCNQLGLYSRYAYRLPNKGFDCVQMLRRLQSERVQ